MESERVWRPRTENERAWRPRMENERMKNERAWRPRMENKRMETWRAGQECRVQKRITELHRTLDSPVNFGPGEEVPHLGSGVAHRCNTSITGISGTAAVSIGWKR